MCHRRCSFLTVACSSADGMHSKNQVFNDLGTMSINGHLIEEEDSLSGDYCAGRQCGKEHENGDTALAATSTPAKRPFCERCRKAQKMCICDRFQGVVNNKIRITIMQHPQEKKHPIGSARVALLGLRNVAIVTVSEADSNNSFRIRPKVPGSKRSIAGRGGKKAPWKEKNLDQGPAEAESSGVCCFLAEFFEGLRTDGVPYEEQHKISIVKEDNFRDNGAEPLTLMPGELDIPPWVALLYPSEKAVELSQEMGTLLEGCPSHLIVLDGTWSKAKRIYFENPWLHNMRHFKLPPSAPSLYEGVRKQPKLGYLSTLESIIYALKILEPETEGLDGLLQVFDSMVEDQRQCKQLRYFHAS